MPGPYEVIKARVQQKKATEADWLAVDDELGPLLDGEQAFVVDDTGAGINFKIGDGTRKFSELPYFISYFSNVLNQKILQYIDGNTDITIAGTFRNFSCLYDIILINNSGTDMDFKVGTTEGGNELMEVTVPDGVYPINLRKVFQANTTVYLSGLAAKNYTIFIVYFQYDENPVSTPVDSSTFRWPRCFKGMFEPLTDADLDAAFDFTTGLGIPGTPWENCAISGTNGTEDMGRFYPVGWKVGDSLRPATTFGGDDTGTVTLTEDHIPAHNHKILSGAGPAGNIYPDPAGSKSIAWSSNHLNGNQDYDMKQAADDNPSVGHTSSFGSATPTPIDLRPKSKIVLFFVAISD